MLSNANEPAPEEAPPPSGRRNRSSEVELAGAAGRQHDRHELDVDVSLVSEHNFYAAFSENISEYGLFVATHVLRPVGETLEFTINLPNLPVPIRGVGEVRWVRTYDETSNLPPGLGLRFVGLERAAEQAILHFVQNRQPLRYDGEP
jgi:uncharacterized protein (TIGR02266 family)